MVVIMFCSLTYNGTMVSYTEQNVYILVSKGDTRSHDMF